MKITTKSIQCFLLAGVLSASAQPPEKFLEKLRAPAPGIEPVVLFLQDANNNQGIGNPGLVASMGTPLTATGRDPWGNENGAFGPEADAESGAEIAYSVETGLLTGDAGSLVVCFQSPAATDEPAMILSRGTYGENLPFDLRVHPRHRVILYTGDPNSKATALEIGTFFPGTWVFLALSWQLRENGIVLQTILGELSDGGMSTVGEFTIDDAGDPSKPVLIGGRVNPRFDPVVLHGGLFTCVAIYQEAIPLEVLEEMLSDAATETRP